MKRANFTKFLWRAIAFLFDFSLAFWPFHLLISLPRLEVYQRKLDRIVLGSLKFTGISQSFLEIVSCLAMIFLMTQVIRVYTTFLLGRTLGQVFLGIRPSGSFWWKRFSGSLRILIETILTPFLFSHLMLFFKGRSTHEFLSDADLKHNISKIRPFIAISLSILCLVNIIFSASALNFSDYHDFNYLQTKVDPLALKNEVDFSNFKEMGSLTFGFSVFTSSADHQFFIFPSLEVKKVGKRLLKAPILYFIDKRSGVIGKLTIERKFNVKNLLRSTMYGNPLIKANFPELFDKKKMGRQVDDPIISDQFIKLIDQVFTLSFSSLPSRLISMGPILLGPAKLRRNILRFLSNTATVQVQRVVLNEDRFLRLQQLYNKGAYDEFPFQETFIGLEKLNGKVLQLKWGRDESSAIARGRFEKYFLSSLSLIDLNWNDRKFNSKDDWNAMDIIDGIMKKKLSPADKLMLCQQVHKNLLAAIELNKSIKSTAFNKHILQAINRYLFLQNSKSGNMKNTVFRNQLINLKNEYFND